MGRAGWAQAAPGPCSRVGVLGWGGTAGPTAGSAPLSPRQFPQAQGSCQSELHRALERLAASQTRTHEDLYVIPIPNCDRNGNFHPKQVGQALARHGAPPLALGGGHGWMGQCRGKAEPTRGSCLRWGSPFGCCGALCKSPGVG